MVLTTYPLKSILHKPELSGRLTKWTVELSECDITFQLRTALKSQGLANFISGSFEKCHLFFSTLRKSKDFEWTPAYEQALQDLKKYLTSPPLLSKQKDGEQLFIYLAVSECAVSTILIREEENT